MPDAHRRRTLLLFGEGASRGSCDVYPSPPPLGNELLGEILKQGNPGRRVFGIVEAFSDLHWTSWNGKLDYPFETLMEDLLSSGNENAVDTFLRATAATLLRYKPGPRNLYGRVIDYFGIYDVLYATLNYDLLLELALAQRGISAFYGKFIGYFTSAPRRVNVIKVHGSANFWLEGHEIVGCNIRNGRRLTGNVRPLSGLQAFQKSIAEERLPPCMSIYEPMKRTHFGEDVVDWLKQTFGWAVAQAEQIIIVGAKIVPQDDHVWGPLRRSRARVIYLANHPDDEVLFQRWAGGEPNFECLSGGFQHLVDHLSSDGTLSGSVGPSGRAGCAHATAASSAGSGGHPS